MFANMQEESISEWVAMGDVEVEPEYDGARIEGEVATSAFLKKMMEDFHHGKCLHKRLVLILYCFSLQFYEMLHMFRMNRFPAEDNPYLFNGDLVDRGTCSVEVILTLFAFKCMSSSAIYISRGNHESKQMNKKYGFENEVKSKLGDEFVELFAEVFCCLPLAHVLNGKIFVVHGGLSSADGLKLSEIKEIDRFCEPPDEGLMCDLLWSDPQRTPGRSPNKRGVGIFFGEDVTKKFLEDNNLDLVVRSHQVKHRGFSVEHDGKLITVYSAPYLASVDIMTFGAVVRFKAPDMKPQFIKFIPGLEARQDNWNHLLQRFSQPQLYVPDDTLRLDIE